MSWVNFHNVAVQQRIYLASSLVLPSMGGNTAHKEFVYGQSFFRDFILVCDGFP